MIDPIVESACRELVPHDERLDRIHNAITIVIGLNEHAGGDPVLETILQSQDRTARINAALQAINGNLPSLQQDIITVNRCRKRINYKP